MEGTLWAAQEDELSSVTTQTPPAASAWTWVKCMAVTETSCSLIGLFIPLVGSYTNIEQRKLQTGLRNVHTALLPPQR